MLAKGVLYSTTLVVICKGEEGLSRVVAKLFFVASGSRERSGAQPQPPGEGPAALCNPTLYLASFAFQCDHRDLAGCPPLVTGELRIEFRLPGVESVSLLTSDDGGNGLVGRGSDLDRDFGVGYQIVVPVRVGWGTAFGGEDEQAVAVA